MDAPRTRYKVVERGRRLEVIDTWNGNAPVRTPVRAEAPPPRPRDAAAAVETVRASRLDQRGRRVLTTSPWYDAKGPRTITVSEEGERRLNGVRIIGFVLLMVAAAFSFLAWPILLILPFALLSGETRKSLRAGATRFLDGLAQAGT